MKLWIWGEDYPKNSLSNANFRLLSLNLGVMNLLPFPALDGGKLFLILIEKLEKTHPTEKEAWISLVGFALLIALMIATLFNDIPKLFRGF